MSLFSIRNQFLHLLFNSKRVIEKFGNCFSGRCFIVGNGPSINNQELANLKNEYCFVSNRFVLHKNFDKINPDFYCLSDPEFLKNNNRDILKKIKDKMSTNINLQLFTSNRFSLNSWFRKSFINFNVNYIFIRTDEKVFNKNTLSVDLKRGLYFGNTIIIDLCIPLAIMMGFDEVILLGCDLNYSSNNSHFFGHQKGTESKAKNIDRREWVAEVNTSYGICNEFAISKKVRLLDATEGGKITTLDKINFQDLF